MKKFTAIITILMILMILVPGVCLAEEALVLPNDWQYGEVLTHQKLNKYFQTIQIHNNEKLVTVFDYGAPDNTIRVFAHTNSPTTLTAVETVPGMETWTYSDG